MLKIFAQIVFWVSTVALFYAYVGYPLLVWIVSRARPQKIKHEPFEPFVTILITAYNEEKDIRAKLENTLQIDYPLEKLEILVASDGSTDKTDQIVKEFASRGVKLFRQEGRLGKTFTQNEAVKKASSEIILFSDATTMYTKNVLRKILPNFADTQVGCVAGKLIYVDESNSTVGMGAKNYWSYETFLKKAESRACSLIGASGCLYAIRKSAYKPMYAEACSDFLICTILYKQNLRSIFEPDAICTEKTNRRIDKEFPMRVRIISQTLLDLWRHREMLNPIKYGFFSIELISHKIFRYGVPFFLFLILISAMLLAFSLKAYAIAFALQIIFYAAAFFGWLLDRSGRNNSVLVFPLYFVMANLAAIIALYKLLRGERFARWDPVRETNNENSKVFG